jgi:hypothetical protein
MDYTEIYNKLKSKMVKVVFLTQLGKERRELNGAEGFSYLDQYADKAEPVYDRNGTVQFKIGDANLVFHYEWIDYENMIALSDRFNDD